MKNLKYWFKRRKYDWHLRRVERINMELRDMPFAVGRSIQGLVRARQNHIDAMNLIGSPPKLAVKKHNNNSIDEQ